MSQGLCDEYCRHSSRSTLLSKTWCQSAVCSWSKMYYKGEKILSRFLSLSLTPVQVSNTQFIVLYTSPKVTVDMIIDIVVFINDFIYQFLVIRIFEETSKDSSWPHENRYKRLPSFSIRLIYLATFLMFQYLYILAVSVYTCIRKKIFEGTIGFHWLIFLILPT